MVVFATIKEKGASLRPGQGYTGLLEKMERDLIIDCFVSGTFWTDIRIPDQVLRIGRELSEC